MILIFMGIAFIVCGFVAIMSDPFREEMLDYFIPFCAMIFFIVATTLICEYYWVTTHQKMLDEAGIEFKLGKEEDK